MDAFDRICEKVQAQKHTGFDYRLWYPDNTLFIEYSEDEGIEFERAMELISWVQFHQYLSPSEVEEYRCPGEKKWPLSKYRTTIKAHFRRDIMPDGEYIRPDAPIPEPPPLFFEWDPITVSEKRFCDRCMVHVLKERTEIHTKKQEEELAAKRMEIDNYKTSYWNKAAQPEADTEKVLTKARVENLKTERRRKKVQAWLKWLTEGKGEMLQTKWCEQEKITTTYLHSGRREYSRQNSAK